uniref:Uncharacterized protein n=1 Tax=Triticum urartu TaxID=4572 RepID=A0A8R7UNT8_TRIUA
RGLSRPSRLRQTITGRLAMNAGSNPTSEIRNSDLLCSMW